MGLEPIGHTAEIIEKRIVSGSIKSMGNLNHRWM
jgi:hypothetical protein